MVLTDGNVVCIDEFDKMIKSKRVAIHQAIHQAIKSGSATILAFINNNYNKKALTLYDEIIKIKKDNPCHMLAIKACLNAKDFEKEK